MLWVLLQCVMNTAGWVSTPYYFFQYTSCAVEYLVATSYGLCLTEMVLMTMWSTDHYCKCYACLYTKLADHIMDIKFAARIHYSQVQEQNSAITSRIWRKQIYIVPSQAEYHFLLLVEISYFELNCNGKCFLCKHLMVCWVMVAVYQMVINTLYDKLPCHISMSHNGAVLV